MSYSGPLSPHPDSYFFMWASYLPYAGNLGKVMAYSSTRKYNVFREVKTLTPTEQIRTLTSELSATSDLLSNAQSCLISTVAECNRLRAENEFMLRLINQHKIGE